MTKASSSRPRTLPVLPNYSNYITSYQSLNNNLSMQFVTCSPMAMPPVFKCKYCHRKWPSQQACAGHQNSHKQEREDEKRREQLLLQSVQPIGVQPLAATEVSNQINILPTAPQAFGPNDGPSRVLYPHTLDQFGATNTGTFYRLFGNAITNMPPVELNLFPRREANAAAADAETAGTESFSQANLLALRDRSDNEALDLSLRL